MFISKLLIKYVSYNLCTNFDGDKSEWYRCNFTLTILNEIIPRIKFLTLKYIKD